MLRLPRTAEVVPALEVVASSPSTNGELRERPATPHGTVLATDDQTAGRGRLDRVWTSPPGTALAVSVVLRPTGHDGAPLPSDRLGWIPLAAGLAMVEALDPVLPGATLKWPNDVLAGGRKLCGVLAELAPSGALVLGAGLNTRMTAEQLPVPSATSLAVEGVAVDDDLVDAVLARYLRVVLDDVAALGAAGGDANATGLAARVAARCATLGSLVRVELPGGDALVGTAVALDDDGRLRVRDDAGAVSAVAAGDVIHLR